ncbi:hypothetical protein JXD38_10275 [candidate division WOR-3 bacterium]|nr:hypothetical protein [candidate division WOR-3 bacterium]
MILSVIQTWVCATISKGTGRATVRATWNAAVAVVRKQTLGMILYAIWGGTLQVTL